jgi:hypothetical protein
MRRWPLLAASARLRWREPKSDGTTAPCIGMERDDFLILVFKPTTSKVVVFFALPDELLPKSQQIGIEPTT